MSQVELSRVKEDLDTIKQAVGLDSPYGVKEIVYIFLIALFALLTGIWYIFERPYSHPLGILFLLGATMSMAIALARGYHFRYGRTLWGQKKFLVTLLLMLLAINVYGIFLATPGVVSIGQATFLLGMVALCVALLMNKSHEVLGLAIPLMLAGIIIPQVSIHPLFVFSFAFSVGCLIMAMILWLCRPKSNPSKTSDH